MAKNKISDMRDHLFAQLERLNDETLDKTEMELEMRKAKAMASVSTVLVESLKAETLFLKQLGGETTGFISETRLIEAED